MEYFGGVAVVNSYCINRPGLPVNIKKNKKNSKWPRFVFNPQKSSWPESKCNTFVAVSSLALHQNFMKYFFILASTFTPKLPLSPRPNLTLFPSRETASATKSMAHRLTQSYSYSTICTFISGTNIHIWPKHLSFKFDSICRVTV